jgi:hypothetical protein
MRGVLLDREFLGLVEFTDDIPQMTNNFIIAKYKKLNK